MDVLDHDIGNNPFQEQDLKEVAPIRPKESASKQKICLKIKIPTATKQLDESGFRVCEFCGKKFTSGKARGGHKRIHNQALKNPKKNSPTTGTNKSRVHSQNPDFKEEGSGSSSMKPPVDLSNYLGISWLKTDKRGRVIIDTEAEAAAWSMMIVSRDTRAFNLKKRSRKPMSQI